MKKKLNIIVLLTLVVLTLFTFGCKKETELGNLEDTAKWNNMQSLGGASQNTLVIKAEKYDIDWWVLTDMKGIVFEDYTKDSSEKGIAKGSEVTLTFDVDENTNLLLWIAQDDRVPKTKGSDGSALSAGSKDFKGKVIVSPSQGYKVSDSGYREEVSPVGVVEILCDETGSVAKGKTTTINGTTCTGGTWNGDYKITELWPLTNEDGPQWKAAEGLKFYLDDPIEEGESKKVIYPAGNSVFAIKQPDRFTDADMKEGSGNYSTYTQQKDWYWCAAFYDSIASGNFDSSSSDKTVKYYGPVDAHDVTKAKSSECNAYFKITTGDDGILYKSALGTTYIINDSDIVDGSSEK